MATELDKIAQEMLSFTDEQFKRFKEGESDVLLTIKNGNRRNKV